MTQRPPHSAAGGSASRGWRRRRLPLLLLGEHHATEAEEEEEAAAAAAAAALLAVQAPSFPFLSKGSSSPHLKGAAAPLKSGARGPGAHQMLRRIACGGLTRLGWAGSYGCVKRGSSFSTPPSFSPLLLPLPLMDSLSLPFCSFLPSLLSSLFFSPPPPFLRVVIALY